MSAEPYKPPLLPLDEAIERGQHFIDRGFEVGTYGYRVLATLVWACRQEATERPAAGIDALEDLTITRIDPRPALQVAAPTVSAEGEREGFEAWWRYKNFHPAMLARHADYASDYANAATNYAWYAYRAGRSEQQQWKDRAGFAELELDKVAATLATAEQLRAINAARINALDATRDLLAKENGEMFAELADRRARDVARQQAFFDMQHRAETAEQERDKAVAVVTELVACLDDDTARWINEPKRWAAAWDEARSLVKAAP